VKRSLHRRRVGDHHARRRLHHSFKGRIPS
jgi:hypothetical protein